MRMELREKALDKLYKRRDRIDIPDYQRTRVWSQGKKKKLIDTILRGWHIPKLYLRKIDEDSFECVDGQQRLAAIWEFFDNKLSLSDESTRDFGGPLYKSLSPSTQDNFDDFELQIEEIEDASDDDIQELFQRLQLGVPLNPAEKLNAIGGDLRDFLRGLPGHSFFTNKVAIKDTRYAYLDMMSKVCFLEIHGIQPQMRFKQLENMYNSNKNFSSNSPAAKTLKKTLNYLDKAFLRRSSALRNRASIISVCYLAVEVVKERCDRGTAESFGQFVKRFMDDLRFEVERGSAAHNKDLLSYQSAISYGSTGGESIRTRHDILSRGLAINDPRFAPLIGKSRRQSVDEVVQLIASEIADLVYQCNSAYSGKHGQDLFKATNETQKALQVISKPVKDIDGYGVLIDSLYKLIYESSGNGKRLPGSQLKVVKDIKDFRTSLRHDTDHGREAKKRRRVRQIGKVLEKYTGKVSIQVLTRENFSVGQMKILKTVRDELEQLKNVLP